MGREKRGLKFRSVGRALAVHAVSLMQDCRDRQGRSSTALAAGRHEARPGADHDDLQPRVGRRGGALPGEEAS